VKRKFARILGVALALALMSTLCLGSIALADDPTTVTVDWVGDGVVAGGVTAGDDANASFYSGGNYHVGAFSATDSGNNPYGYGVDSCSFSMETAIVGGGEAWLTVNRTDAKLSYGAAGQQSYTYVVTDDGDAVLQNRSGTNYASMKDCNYGWHSSDHVTVTGASNYIIERYMDGGSGNYAGLWANGSGDADLDCMSAEASAGRVRLGKGCGCYTNADFTATGSGVFQLDGVGNTSATTAMAPGMTGASSFTIIASWVNSFSVSDYSTTCQ